jgi:hypothetical protein
LSRPEHGFVGRVRQMYRMVDGHRGDSSYAALRRARPGYLRLGTLVAHVLARHAPLNSRMAPNKCRMVPNKCRMAPNKCRIARNKCRIAGHQLVLPCRIGRCLDAGWMTYTTPPVEGIQAFSNCPRL